MWYQKEITLKARTRGFHLITDEILKQLPELSRFEVGLAHFFIQHTSASISLNENYDPDVRYDVETQLNRMIPDGASWFTHRLEGPDDMPAHIKSILVGPELTIPINRGALKLGTWQGIYLGEHRDQGGARRVTVTIQGE